MSRLEVFQEGQGAIREFLARIDQGKIEEIDSERRQRLEREGREEVFKEVVDIINRYGGVPQNKENLNPYDQSRVAGDRRVLTMCIQTPAIELNNGQVFLRRVFGEFDLGDGPDPFERSEIVFQSYDSEEAEIPIVILEHNQIKDGSGKVLNTAIDRKPVLGIMSLMRDTYY